MSDETTDQQVGPTPKRTSAFGDFLRFVGVLLVAGVLALVLIMFVFRSYAVSGSSMETTLQDGDKMLIWKLPRTVAHITGHQYVPKRGDIIVVSMNDLSACGQSGSREIIKRVIGLPGEHVVVKNGVEKVYNRQQPNGFVPDRTLPYDRDNHIPRTDRTADVTLSSNQLFISGDNRPNSCDSRDFGPIETSQITGKLVIRLLPANKLKVF